MLNLNPTPIPKCKNCGKSRGDHHAGDFGCPMLMRTRIGYTHFSETVFYEPKRVNKKKDKKP